VNNPDNQNIKGKNAGPLPRGQYTIGPERNYTEHNGKVLMNAMKLTPNPSNQMFGRSGFLIHGSNDYSRQDSSLGCIVLRPSARNVVGGGGIIVLEVVQ
jgi:hypothetical protein